MLLKLICSQLARKENKYTTQAAKSDQEKYLVDRRSD
uniref:Uncharacterized protein n=1 Tax=Gloeothece verrucosa (strain PCC 7822) TaxID=497965 RepID=E0ULG1_GLOV7|nr:hypothetical protein Cyan7822_5937 [Gloeothece verrucosa PCC 7822]